MIFAMIYWFFLTFQGASEKDIVHSGLAQTMEGAARVSPYKKYIYCFWQYLTFERHCVCMQKRRQWVTENDPMTQ